MSDQKLDLQDYEFSRYSAPFRIDVTNEMCISQFNW